MTTKVGDRYVVAKSDGSELRIPTRDVEMHCLDLDEAYVRRRQTVSPRDASAHLQLADWCLRCGLHARAADELLAAIAIAPRDPRIGGLERRLRSATDPVPARETVPAVHPSPPHQDDSERVLSALPSDAVESFASRVQPLLLNRCGSNACHGGRSSTQFQLISPGWGKTITLRYTQRNLLAAYRQVDSAKPEASPLLTIPGRPHGGLESSVFGERDRPQLELLDAWVRKACLGDAGAATGFRRQPAWPAVSEQSSSADSFAENDRTIPATIRRPDCARYPPAAAPQTPRRQRWIFATHSIPSGSIDSFWFPPHRRNRSLLPTLQKLPVARQQLGQFPQFFNRKPVNRLDLGGIRKQHGVGRQLCQPPRQLDLPRRDAPPKPFKGNHVTTKLLPQFPAKSLAFRLPLLDRATGKTKRTGCSDVLRPSNDQ